MDEVAKVEANRIYLPGVNIQIEPKRSYPYGTMMAHVLGYVSEINNDELKSKEYKNYSPGDYMGKYGLEKMYETYLRGKDGEKRVEVDAIGREVRTLDVKEPIPGNNLYLNIDDVIDKKIELIKIYKTQIKARNFIDSIRGLACYRGMIYGKSKYAEAFFISNTKTLKKLIELLD